MTSLSEIVFQTDRHWVRRAPKKGFEVYRVEGTHSVRCAIIGFEGQEGLDRAKVEIERREGKS